MASNTVDEHPQNRWSLRGVHEEPEDFSIPLLSLRSEMTGPDGVIQAWGSVQESPAATVL